jgi:D-alanyl-lipoteichoic acid acyltransferase DltB (MBOAT superfamily)
VNQIFGQQESLNSASLIVGAVLFSFQIYGDFSGYSDIALGTARLFGIELLNNFNFPYFAKNVAEFWKRWHISLTSWFRDYLYIPLGGNRVSKLRRVGNTLTVFLVSGLWHGANFTFVIWGALHGLALALDKLRMTYIKNAFNFIPGVLQKHLGVLITFHFVCFAWVFFKAENITVAFDMLHQIRYNFNLEIIPQIYHNYNPVIGMMVFGFLLHSLRDKLADDIIAKFNNIPLWVYVAAFTVLIVLLVQFKTATPIMPIYLQF